MIKLRALTLTLSFFWILISACSGEKAKLRSIRGHVADFQGVVHGHGAKRAERYCSECHGLTLAGGAKGEPSCLKCHGVRWEESGPTQVFAPTDTHTLEYGGYRHHQEIADVDAICASCHGLDLQGLDENGPPSCYLCHEPLWER